MIGTNELVLNEATMNEVVQLWVNANFTTPPTVGSVEVVQDGYTKTFRVQMSEKPQETKEQP